MTKRLNTDAIANELRDVSPFFRRKEQPAAEPATPSPPVPTHPVADPSSQPGTSVHPDQSSRSPERENARPTVRPNARTGERRHARRYSFEIYEDQIAQVKRLALEDQLRGGTLNQSEIVREAIDRYLKHLGKTGE